MWVIGMYSYFDAHCDTMSKMYKNRLGLDSAELMVSTKNLEGYCGAVQVFALFNGGKMDKATMLDCFAYFKGECEKLPGLVKICKSGTETDENKAPLSAILAIEGLGNQPDFKIGDIGDFYNTGVRFMSLGWNNDNILCGGCEGNKGLTELGYKALSEMEKYRIILDTSHMSDKSFFDALENYSLPICATHSVSRSVHNHRRNLTDEEFLEITRRGGVCGINFYPPFLTDKDADIDTVIGHIDYFLSLGGEDSIGLGSDFDGIGATPRGLENSSHIYRLADRMLSLNYREQTVEKIMHKNFENLFKRFTM